MKAPNSLMLTTVPSRIIPSSKSVTIVLMYLRALSIISLSTPHTETIPSSEMSILTPVSSIMALITLPLLPTTSPILSGLIWIVSIFGAYALTSLRGSAIAGFIHVSIMNNLASLVLAMAPSTMSLVRP